MRSIICSKRPLIIVMGVPPPTLCILGSKNIITATVSDVLRPDFQKTQILYPSGQRRPVRASVVALARNAVDYRLQSTDSVMKIGRYPEAVPQRSGEVVQTGYS